ncbi:hypothetical protein OG604_16810 [Streptomyces sp. NBC_01231]|nr:hypothetical protein OG604_16810 [Streptomyces sp. NBC_01231]
MNALVASLALLGTLLGAVAQLPVHLSLIGGLVIGTWLTAFLVREHLTGR